MNRPRRRHRERGQALVEFALVFPVFALIVFSIIQFGMLFGSHDALTNAVREAARYAATVPVANTSDAGSCASGKRSQVFGQLRAALQQKVPGYAAANLVDCGASAPWSTVDYCRRANPDGTSSIWVQVTAVYRHPLYVPFVGNIIDQFDGSADGQLRASASEQMRVETYGLSGSYLGGFAECT